MSQTIDDRIVQLEFDNNQFEKNVNESLTTLQKLKSSLDLESSAKNLTALTNASNKVDFSHLSESIDNLNDKFSTMRMAGLMALSNIVDGAMGLAKKLGSALMAPITQMKTGGWARAMNLNQAEFMLKGMADLGVDAAAVMENVNEAVSGTAYSLDEAAKVAGQFAASGIKAGTEMESALKAVSGVAGMTGSSFGEIGDIFASIAGQGKMMKYQLNQLSSRGLNAAAILAEAFGTTEEEIREMVHNGEIDFQTFSDVMFETFGDHAKKANETFEGALANMKSALNRIGAEFAKPIQRDAVPVFNSLRLMINSIKENMGDVIWIFDKLSHAVSNKLVAAIDKITAFFKSDSFKNNGLKDLNEALLRAITSILKIGKAISEAFKTVFNGSIGDKINDFCKGLNNLTKILAPTETGLMGFKQVLIIIFTLIKKVGQVINFVVTKIGGPLLKVIVIIVKNLFNIIGIIMKVTSAIGDFIRQSGILEHIIFSIEEVIQLAKDRFEEFKRQLSDTSTTVGKVAQAISKAFKTIVSVILTIAALPIMAIYTAFQKLRNLDFTRVISALKNFKQLVIDAFNYIKELPVVQGIIEGIKLAFMGLIGVFYYLGTAIESFFAKLANGEITIDSIRAKILDIPNAIKRVFNKIQAFVNGNTVLSKILDGLEKAVDFIKRMFNKIKVAFSELTPAKAMLFAFAMSMLTMSLIFNKLGITLDKALQSTSINLGLLKVKLNGGVFQIDKYTAFVSALASALTALTIAFWVLGNQVKNLKETAIILGSFIGTMALLAGALAIIQKILKIEGAGIFREFAWDMAIMAAGVMSIAIAIKVLSEASFEGILPKLITLGVIMGILLGISFIFSKFNGTGSFKTAVLLIAFAGSVVAICLALRALNNVDLSGLKGAWPELLAILGGIAAVAVMMSKISSILIASIAVLAVLLIFSKKLYEIGSQLVNNIDNSTVLFEKFKAGVDKIADLISETIHYIYDKFEALDPIVKKGVITIIAIAIAGIIGTLVAATKTLGFGILEIAKNGKYIKKLGAAFLMFTAGIALLIYMTKLLADWTKDTPNLDAAMRNIAILIVVCGAFIALSFLGDEKAIKKFGGFLTSLSIVILSLGAFSVMMGTLTEEEFVRATKVLQKVLVSIGTMIMIIGACNILASKGNPASFGTFAGITMLFAAIIGTIAWLMLALKDPQDYVNLGAALLSIGIVFTAIYALFTIIGKIQDTGQWKTIISIFGGLSLIGIAIAGAAKLLPNEYYIEKVATVGIAMIAMLAVVAGIAFAIQKFASKNAQTFNPIAAKSVRNSFALMAEMIVGILIIAGSLALLQSYDPLDLLAKAGVIIAVIGSLAIIALVIQKFNEKMKAINAMKTVALMGIMTIIFSAIALVTGILEHFGGTADRMIAVSQVIMLVIFELAAIATALGYLAGQAVLGTVSLAPIIALTVIFAALATVIGILEHFGGKADRLLAVSQVIMLVILELGIIVAALGAIAPLTLAAIAGTACIMALAAVFTVLALVIEKIQHLDVDNIQPKIDKVLELIQSLVMICGQLATLTLGSVGMLAGAAAMIIMVAAINLLVEALRKINEIGVNNVSAGLEQIAVALGMLTDAGQALSDLGKGMLVLALGITAVGAACLIAAPGILALGVAFGVSGALIGTALNLLADAMNKFLDVLSRGINGVKQFFSDLVSSFTNNPAVQLVIGATKKLGGDTGESFTDGFRNSSLDWHSPPGIITSFLSDAASAFVNSSAAQGLINAAKRIADFVAKGFEKVFRDGLGWHSDPDTIINFLADAAHAMFQSPQANDFIESAKDTAKGATDKFKDTFENFDGTSLGKNMMDTVTGGFIDGEGGLLQEFTNTLGAAEMWASQMSSAVARGYGTISDFQYQINDKYSQLKREEAYYRKKSSEFGHDNLYTQRLRDAEQATKDFESQYSKVLGISDPNAFDELAEGADDYTKSTGKATNATKDFVDSLEQTLASQLNLFSKFEQKNPMNKDELLNNMRSQIKGMTDWAGQMNKLATMGIDQGLYKKLAEMGPQGAEYVGAFTQMTAEELEQANEMWAQSLVLPGDISKQIGVNFNEMGKNVPGSFATGMRDANQEAVDATQELSTSTYDTMHDGEWKFGSPSYTAWQMGFWIDLGFGHGILENMHFAINAIETMCNLMVAKAEELLNPKNFKPIGAGVVEGVNQGIEENMSILETAMQKLASMVEQAARSSKGFDVNSPSKRMIPIGEGVGEGLALGINRSSAGVTDSISNMADNAVFQMKQTIANIASMINNEMEDPVITPVLDLSKVQAGARLLNSTFSANAAIAAGGSQLGALQNGQYPQGGITFNQYNNSPKALSRIDIYRDTRNMLSQFRQATT